MLTGSQVRKTFIDYFAARGHRVVRSSSLIPANDPTLLFTNAGMNQFKEVFLGLEQRDYNRATSSQKCMRAGGKHNDLENVGRTRRHLTFFEMLGNFSFGDYFKKEAIEYAWELITREFAISKEKLYVTVFSGEQGLGLAADDEAVALWHKVGVARDRIFGMGMKDNFWQMGDTGPCGPCSEIHYDMGPAASVLGHTDCKFPCPDDCERYVEFWNLVFMQFNRDASGKFAPLPKPSIDTGMGLERVTSVLQGKLSVFETDLLFSLVEEAAEMAGTSYGEKAENDVSLRILADHARAATFLIHDGVLPANDGRGYVLRKVLRRAVRHGRQLGMNDPFLYKLTGKVAETMADAYPELLSTTDRVAAVVKSEEQRFAHTMTIALQEFDKVARESGKAAMARKEAAQSEVLKRFMTTRGELSMEAAEELYLGLSFEEIKEEARKRDLIVSDIDLELLRKNLEKPVVLPGEKLFRLYDTFGMPLDWIKEIADERGLGVDELGFEQEMQRQRERARASWKGVAKEVLSPVYAEALKKGKTEFEGYKQTTSHDCMIVDLIVDRGPWEEPFPEPWPEPPKEWTPPKDARNRMVQTIQLPAGVKAELVLDHTPFYAESGGQVGDAGMLLREGTEELLATVEDTYSPVSGIIAHRIVSRAPIKKGDKITAVVNAERRLSTMRNHTATHLLHAALRQILGTHVKQAGSVVEPSRLRFDFSHFASVDDIELAEIEKLANDAIQRNTAVETEVMELDRALETGAMAFFGEKYPERVRVVIVPEFSKELCGGTHVKRTGDIGLMKVISEGSISAGVRRVEAVTRERALEEFQKVTSEVRHAAAALNAAPSDLAAAVARLAETEKTLTKQVESLRLKLAQTELADAESKARQVKDVKVLALRMDNLERGQMRTLADSLRQKLHSGVVVLASATDGKVALIAALTPDLTKRLHAGKIAQAMAQKLGGTGGGRPDLAEAGGKDVNRLDTALNEAYELISQML